MHRFLGPAFGTVLLCSMVVFAPASTCAAREPVVAERPLVDLAGLDELLQNWERASAKMQTLEATHHCYQYDKVFEIEKRGEGSFYLEGRKKGRLELAPRNTESADHNAKLDRWGEPYKLEPVKPEAWVWTGDMLYLIDHKERSATCVDLPESPVETTSQVGFFNWKFFESFCRLGASPLSVMPLIYGIRADELKARFDLRIVKRTGNSVHLSAIPKEPSDKDNYQEISVILDLNTYLISAWKAVDPSGSKETIYVFTDWRVNQPPRGGGNPLVVNLPGYAVHVIKAEKSNTKPPRENRPILVPTTLDDVARSLTKGFP